MNCTEVRPAGVRKASEKQLNMIKALSWQLRPYYLHAQWQEIREGLLELLRIATMQKCHRIIKRMVCALEEKKAQSAKKVWLPMDYRLDDPAWQANIVRIASSLFPEDAESFQNLDDLASWRELKNRMEREEMKRACECVPDEFENDLRAAAIEEERWKRDQRPYAELIAGIDWLEPTPEID